MNNGAQQGGLIDSRTSNLFASLTSMWWDNPSPWPMPNNSTNDDEGEQTLYLPGFIPEIFDKIYPTSVAPITMQPYKLDHAPTASSHIIQAAGAGPSIDVKNLALSIDVKRLRLAREAERFPNGRFKPANQCALGTTVPDSTPEPPESAQPTREFGDDTAPPNSHPCRSRRLRASAGDSLCPHELSPAPCQWRASSSPKPEPVLGKQPCIDNSECYGARRKKCGVTVGTTWYCGKCQTDGADHSYRECPFWKEYGFCDKVCYAQVLSVVKVGSSLAKDTL